MRKIYLISAMDKEVIAANDEDIVYKIGVTKQKVEARLKQLQTGTDKRLDIISVFESHYPFKVERNLHNRFKSKKENREWFNLTKEDIESFQTLCQIYENNFKLLEDSFNPFF